MHSALKEYKNSTNTSACKLNRLLSENDIALFKTVVTELDQINQAKRPLRSLQEPRPLRLNPKV